MIILTNTFPNLSLTLDFEVYIKTKLDQLATDEALLAASGTPTKDRNLENYSTKSYDESKASVYFTPTEADLLSPQAPQTSPIHINYIDGEIGIPDNSRHWKPCKFPKFVIENQRQRMSKRTNRLRGGDYLAEENGLENGDLGLPFMGDYYDDAIEDEFDARRSCRSKRASYAINHSEKVPLNGKSPIASTSKEFHSFEDLSFLDKLAILPPPPTIPIIPILKPTIKKQNSKILLDENGLVTALVAKNSSESTDIAPKPCASLPEKAALVTTESATTNKQNGTPSTSNPHQYHGKHVILAVENSEVREC